MSEYQYYEFVALDQPLSPAQLREVRAISSRAQLTPTSFVNEYEWGDFKGDPLKFLENYYDAMLYYANWGTRRFMVKIAGDTLDVKAAKLYCGGGGESSVEMTSTKTGFVFDFSSRTEEPEDWEEMEQHLSPLLPVREELAGGDLRALYLGWLAGVSAGERDDDEKEPPVPAGLKKLPAPLKALAAFLRIDRDLLAAAAKASTPADAPWDGVEEWVAGLPEKRKNETLVELIVGEAGATVAKLKQEFRKASKKKSEPAASGRTVAQLLEQAGR